MVERASDRLLLEPRWRDPEATPYELLGVEPGAPSEAIRRAYRHLVLCCHPDHYPDAPHLRAQAELVTKRVNGAYLALGQRPGARSRASRQIRTGYSDAAIQAPRRDRGEAAATGTGEFVVVALAGSVLAAVLLAVLLMLLVA